MERHLGNWSLISRQNCGKYCKVPSVELFQLSGKRACTFIPGSPEASVLWPSWSALKENKAALQTLKDAYGRDVPPGGWVEKQKHKTVGRHKQSLRVSSSPDLECESLY